MNPIPELIPLHDNRPGLRSLVQVQVREGAAGAQGETPTLDFIASTAALDRYHEVIEPAGWRVDAYRKNPVFQNAHNYGDVIFTLGKAVTTEVRAVEGGQALCQQIQFATEVNPMARIAYGLYKGGFLNAVSVGFIPLRWEDPPSPCGSGAAGGPRRRYLEQELLEVSAVAIPANPDALALGLKSGAVEKADLQATVELLRGLVGSGAGSGGACVACAGLKRSERLSGTERQSGLRANRGWSLRTLFDRLCPGPYGGRQLLFRKRAARDR